MDKAIVGKQRAMDLSPDPEGLASPQGLFLVFKSKSTAVDKFLFLRKLQLDYPRYYYMLLMEHTEEILPFIYTPTIGEVCERYHRLPLTPVGLYISLEDKGDILHKLTTWHSQRVQVVVVTDGGRILGLGDLGANGMGISEGKITLYTAAAGVDPTVCLPICLDLGTNNPAYLRDPQYKGLRRERVMEKEFDSFMWEFMSALMKWQPHVLVQFEDFGNAHAFRLLDTYRHLSCCFNDDIQGTASITLAALLAALRVSGEKVDELRILFLGAGEAGTGIGQLVATYLHLRYGVPPEEGRQHCFFVDSQGLVCASRKGLQHHKLPFAHDVPYQPDLKAAIQAVRPAALIGVSTIGKAFDEEVVRMMANINHCPIIFALSNPTSKSECTYEEAFRWTSGRVVFASGSPFPPLAYRGSIYYPAQANNAYIFPAVGFAAVLTRCQHLTDEVFVVAAEALAQMNPLEDLKRGRLFPPFSQIRSVSKMLTARVAQFILECGLGLRPEGCGDQWEEYIGQQQWGVHRL